MHNFTNWEKTMYSKREHAYRLQFLVNEKTLCHIQCMQNAMVRRPVTESKLQDNRLPMHSLYNQQNILRAGVPVPLFLSLQFFQLFPVWSNATHSNPAGTFQPSLEYTYPTLIMHEYWYNLKFYPFKSLKYILPQ